MATSSAGSWSPSTRSAHLVGLATPLEVVGPDEAPEAVRLRLIGRLAAI